MKYFLIPLLAAVIFFSCGDSQKGPADSSFAAFDTTKPKTENGLFGKIFRDPAELPELAGYADIGGSVLADPNQENFEYGIGWLQSEKENMIVLEKFVDQPDGKTKYQVLDTILIPKLKENEYISYCQCYRDTVYDTNIIALVKTSDDAYYTEILKAWKADVNAKQIVPLADTKGIKCTNESFGAE